MSKTNVDVAVIGGGAAGLVATVGSAALGARTVLIERDRLGGECTWTGCVPSKALLHIARRAQQMREADKIGLRAERLTIDFGALMASVRETQQWIYQHGESPGYLKQLGVRPLHATARFLDAHTLEIARAGRTRELTFRSAIVASGSRPFIPEIDGLATVDYLTTDTLFDLDELPARLAVLGGGAAGVEIAQACARLGSAVTLVTHDDQLLPGFDRDAATLLQAAMQSEGVEVFRRSTFARVAQRDQSVRVTVAGDAEPLHVDVDCIFIATGRSATTAGLGLEAAGVAYERGGIEVDGYCRTNVRHIFAAGDVTTAPNLTHVAENMSKAAALNALARLPLWKFEQAVIPRVVYTDPEIAYVGRTERELVAAGQNFDVIDLPFEKIDRAVIEGQSEGFVRVYHRFGRVLGATIAGAGAGELIAEYALAMRHGLRLPALAETVHAYPTMMLGARRAADQVYPRMLKPWMVRIFQLLYGYHGQVPEYVGSNSIM